MPYKPPPDSEAVDSLTDIEFKYATTERLAIVRARQKAWHAYRKTCPTAQLRALAARDVGASILFPEYRLPQQVSSLLSNVQRLMDVRFRASRETSLVDGECIGIRVTLTVAK